MGNIRIIPIGMETCDIEEELRDKTISDFLKMKDCAEKENDKFYATDSTYSHNYSYGNLFSDLIFSSWMEIKEKPSLRGIKQITYSLLQESFKHYPKALNTDADFNMLPEPKTNAGFRKNNNPETYICDIESWTEWHQNWLTTHQELIDWSLSENDLFPNPQAIKDIITAELRKHGRPITGDIVTEFHDKIMRHKGTELKAYAEDIGNKICLRNCYVYEEELSKAEKEQSGSYRKIYSILNKDKKKQYISIDFAHGMFEFLDDHGSHKGEFRFDGSHNSDPEIDHSLKTL